MLKILIIDDEQAIRDGLEIIITEHRKDHYLCKKASDGIQALEMIRVEAPDAVLLDIQMPNMNGIELIEELALHYPDIKKIVLSGFDDFEYVRETMKKGAMDYLLKPVDEEQLFKLLVKIEEDIDEERTRRERDRIIENNFRKNMAFLKENFLHELICAGKPADPDEIRKNFIHYGINTSKTDQNYGIIVVSIDNAGYIENQHGADATAADRSLIREVSEKVLEKYGEGSLFQSEKGLVILCFLPDKDKQDTFNTIIRTIYAKMVENTNIRITVSAGRTVSDPSGLHHAYAEALEALKFRFYKKQSSVILASEKNGPFNRLTDSRLCNDISDRIAGCVESENASGIRDPLDDFCEKTASLLIYPNEIIQCFSDIFLKIQSNNVKFKKCSEKTEEFDASYIKTLDVFDTLDAMKDFTCDSYSNILSRMAAVSAGKDRRIVNQIKEYINNNYAKNLSLDKLAEMVYLNPNYLGEIFKKQTQENLVNYLTRVRIEKAKEYFQETGAKTYEIGQWVGYEDSAYFSRVFKKVTGVSPSQYRKII